jgi:hypothetical protein
VGGQRISVIQSRHWEIAVMSKQDSVDQSDERVKEENKPRRHPITMSNSPEETMRRMASFPERAAKFRETLRALREKNSR